MSNSIVPSEPGRPQRPGAALSKPAGGPIHHGTEMSLSSGRPGRDQCWTMLGERVRARILDHAGPVIEWWAQEDSSAGDGRPYAVVFGERGLGVAEPRLNTEHRPVYTVSAYLLDSFRHQVIDHRPPPRRSGQPARGPAGPPRGPDIGLDRGAKGLLGNLPPEAQELMQAPFLGGQEILRSAWYYEGKPHHLTVFMLFLAGPRDVTVATGTKIVPAGHTDETAHWSLTCRRASVTRRIGR